MLVALLLVLVPSLVVGYDGYPTYTFDLVHPHCGDTVNMTWTWKPPLPAGATYSIALREVGFFFDSDVVSVGTFSALESGSAKFTMPSENDAGRKSNRVAWRRRRARKFFVAASR